LRPRDPRYGRQRGGAGGQMQKFSAVGKFHFEPPFKSLDHLVGGVMARSRMNFRFRWKSGRAADIMQ